MKNKIKKIKDKLKKQEVILPDGSKITIKVRPKLSYKKTNVKIKWEKQMGNNVELYAVVNGKPFQIIDENGIAANIHSNNIFNAEVGATFKF